MTVREAVESSSPTTIAEVLRSFRDALGRSCPRGDMRSMPKSHDFLWRLPRCIPEVPLAEVRGRSTCCDNIVPISP